MNPFLSEGKRLHALGFAIHWLRPASKAPIGKRWSSGERASWPSLEKEYHDAQQALNVGVRLGRASSFPDGTTLAVIDCDLKSDDKKHRDEMTAALRGLVSFYNTPLVASGRGNGSRHVYVRVKDASPGYRFTQSKDPVKVKMNVKPSRRDVESLSKEEIAQGFRRRPAWEISFMGEGQQVVLPPSIHPDTGKRYNWAVNLSDWREIPVLKHTPKIEAAPEEAVTVGEFVEVDLVSSTLSDAQVDAITTGANVTDRSAALYGAAANMKRAGFADAEILSALTDRENYLGHAAYEHAETKSRVKAAKWVARYTLTKVKRELSAEAAFEGAAEIDDAPELDAESAAEQAKEILPGWESRIERQGNGDDARPKCTLKNLHLILTGAEGPGVFTRNEFTLINSYAKNTAWGGVKGAEISEQDLINVKFWLSTRFRFEPPKEMVLEAVLKIADENKYHPVREYLLGLKWDGTPRLDRWLETYMGATGPLAYVRSVGRKTICAMVKRILEPGCKFDHVLILEGPQGCGKSTAVRLLSEPWFSDAHITIGDKDAVLAMRLAWVLEIGEMSSMRKADLDHLKQFVSQSVDRIRVPYGRLTETFPRQSIFIGTTNSSEYLKDTTGNRRFWPVTVRQCKFKSLERDRAQLLAEAYTALSLGEVLYLENKEEAKLAEAEQGQRVFQDEWVPLLRDFLKKRPEGFPKGEFRVADLFHDFGPFADWKCSKSEQMRAGEALRLAGFQKKFVNASGVCGNVWAPKQAPIDL